MKILQYVAANNSKFVKLTTVEEGCKIKIVVATIDGKGGRWGSSMGWQEKRKGQKVFTDHPLAWPIHNVDVPYVAEVAVRAALQSSGQNCAGAERFYVHKDVYFAFASESL